MDVNYGLREGSRWSRVRNPQPSQFLDSLGESLEGAGFVFARSYSTQPVLDPKVVCIGVRERDIDAIRNIVAVYRQPGDITVEFLSADADYDVSSFLNAYEGLEGRVFWISNIDNLASGHYIPSSLDKKESVIALPIDNRQNYYAILRRLALAPPYTNPMVGIYNANDLKGNGVGVDIGFLSPRKPKSFCVEESSRSLFESANSSGFVVATGYSTAEEIDPKIVCVGVDRSHTSELADSKVLGKIARGEHDGLTDRTMLIRFLERSVTSGDIIICDEGIKPEDMQFRENMSTDDIPKTYLHVAERFRKKSLGIVYIGDNDYWESLNLSSKTGDTIPVRPHLKKVVERFAGEIGGMEHEKEKGRIYLITWRYNILSNILNTSGDLDEENPLTDYLGNNFLDHVYLVPKTVDNVRRDWRRNPQEAYDEFARIRSSRMYDFSFLIPGTSLFT